MEPSYISFRFDNLYLINQLKLEGRPLGSVQRAENKKEKPFCYRVEVSRNEMDWVQIVDHNKCKCYYTQELYFPKQAVRWAYVGFMNVTNKCVMLILKTVRSYFDAESLTENRLLALL